MRTSIAPLVWTSIALFWATVAGGVPPADPVDFNREIRPLLGRYCLSCHGRNEASRQGGLRLDDRESATGETDSGAAAIVPGEPDASELIARITADDDDSRMPPSEAGPRLADAQIATLRRWIEQGAPYAEHWSFTKPTLWPEPVVQNAAWPRQSDRPVHPAHARDTRSATQSAGRSICDRPPSESGSAWSTADAGGSGRVCRGSASRRV